MYNEQILQYINNSILNNCFLTYNEICSKIKNSELKVIEFDSVLFLIEDKESFSNLYFFQVMDTLYEADRINIELSRYKNISCNIVSKGQKGDIKSLMEQWGFSLYKKYRRKAVICQNVEKMYIENKWLDIKTALKRDIDEIHKILGDNFDEITSFLPSKKELEKLICKEEILVVYDNNRIVSVLIFEDIGLKSYLRAICVKEAYRGQKMGYALMERYINSHIDQTELFYLWVEDTNENANQLYEGLGYRDEGLVDNIYLREEK